MDEEVIRYGIRAWLLGGLGALSALMALPFAMIVIWRFPLVSQFATADLIVLAGLFGFGGCAVYAFGLALQKPVALRMDRHGISGYFAPTLSWSDIKWVPKTLGGGGKVIWLDLHDPRRFWADQSLRARVLSALNFQAGMVAVPVQMIKAPGAEVLETLLRMHKRHAAQPHEKGPTQVARAPNQG